MKVINNKRELKKFINHTCAQLFNECRAATPYEKSDSEDAKAVMLSIIIINKDFLNRVSHVEPGMKPSVYFNSLFEDFVKQTDEVIDQIANLA